MKEVFAVTAVVALLGLGVAAQTDVFNLGTGFTNLETVTVRNPGNTGEVSGSGDTQRTCGAVDYNYSIGKYEVTAKQYTDFLNKVAQTDTYGLYDSNMSSNAQGCKIQQSGTSGSYTYSVANNSMDGYYANRPVNYVSFWDACRFANWLHNGQPTGLQVAETTERGAYTLDGFNGTDNRIIPRNANWKWAVTSEDEWYKAAYYDPNKDGGAPYWDYPTKSDALPLRDMDDISGNNANYYSGSLLIGSPYYRTEVGEFQNSKSAYGTFDQGGNVWEWNDTLFKVGFFNLSLRGGSFGYPDSGLPASFRFDTNYPPALRSSVGFRVSAPGPAYGINNRAAYHPIISAAFASFNFKVWGKVTNLVSGVSFTVDDGSGAPVNVVAPGFVGIQNNNYASAKGRFSGEVPNRVLNAQASDVVKMQ